MTTKEQVVDIVSAAVQALTTELTEKVNTLTRQFETLTPKVEQYNAVTVGRFSRGSSLDLVKSLPDFKGEAQAYPAWREAAHFAIEYYTEGTENYYIAMGIFRNKITGMANAKLSSFNTVLNFKAIIARLDQCYADKRSLQALENEISILRQGGRTICEFYDLVDEHLTLIINKNKMTYSDKEEIANALNERARENALRVFISGLRRPLSDILFSARPADLPTALATAQELESDQKRQKFATIFAAGDSVISNYSQLKGAGGFTTTHPSYRPRRGQDNRVKDVGSIKPTPMDVDPSSTIFRRPTANWAERQAQPSARPTDLGQQYSQQTRQTSNPTGQQYPQQQSPNNFNKRRYENSGISAFTPKAQRINYIELGDSEEQGDIDSVFEYEQDERNDEMAEEHLNFLE